MRRFQVYCAGTGRSGTHSLARIFQSHYRSAHDPDSGKLIDMIMSAEEGLIGAADVAERVVALDRQRELEFNSSQLNRWIIDILVKEFPSAQFILTIRDCYTWLESFLNYSLASPCSAVWLKFRDFRFKKDVYKYTEGDKALMQHGLYALDSYLSYWNDHNLKVIQGVPKERLLIIRTHEISEKIDDIAGFVGVSPGTLDADKAHSNRSVKDFGIIRKIDRKYLESKIETHCGKLMAEYFPGFRNPFEELSR